MASPYPVSSLFGALFFMVRHEPGATEDHAALAAALRASHEPGELLIEVEPESLLIDGRPVMLESPGATMLFEQMYLHGVRSLRVHPDAGEADLIRFATVLGAFPGTYDSYAQVVDALGPSAGRLTLTQGANDFEVFRSMPWRPRGVYGTDETAQRLDVPRIQGETTSEYQQFQELILDPDIMPEAVPEPVAPVMPVDRNRPSLEALVHQGRDAIEREDWGGLLEVALLIAEGESEAPSELASSTYRIELKRLMTRKHLAMIARFLQGERKQDAIALLRRFGADSTEILMDLLIQAMTIGERRGYYSAITQMSEGAEAVVQHLGHQQWYVVRNAADLCGEMGLADAVPDLARQVSHPDERVRKAVAEALGKIGTPQAMEPLRQLMSDSSPAVRLKALAHLNGRGARGMPPALAELLRTEDNADVQHEALLALGRIATPDALVQLREWAQPGGKLLGRKPLAVRLAAVKALTLAGPAAVDIMGTLERDESPEIRAAASAAIAALRP
ncbi:MAG TPA: HEAT repeat domain-containing protein [Gemmatimonadales bacterium]|nr:HEAT repeat domain-containing protein [Gemmatimonadales bacterium]